MASVPHGHGEPDRLEVEEGDRRDEGLEGLGEARLHDELARLDSPALAVRDRPQGHVLRKVVDRVVALLVELQGPAPHGVERAHVVRREFRPAPLGEGALVRGRTVRADRDAGERAGEHRRLGRDVPRDAGQQRLDRLRHVRADEEVREIGVRAGTIEVHHLHPAHVEPAPAQDVRLDGDVGEMVLLHRRSST